MPRMHKKAPGIKLHKIPTLRGTISLGKIKHQMWHDHSAVTDSYCQLWGLNFYKPWRKNYSC